MSTTRKDIPVEIDESSGFCFGVTTAINKAEDELTSGEPLYCLGDIVHNTAEVERLRQKGLQTIDHATFAGLHGAKVLLRAHGEPPSTYRLAKDNNTSLIDATCPVVLKLQQRIKADYDRSVAQGNDLQIVIYGRLGHAEVNGLVGQTDGNAIVVESMDQLDSIDFSRPVSLYSQTTKSLEGFAAIVAEIERRMAPGVSFQYADTICRQVANRVDHLRDFAARHSVILFVAGEKSSNGRILYGHCHEVNPRTHLVSSAEAVDSRWFSESPTDSVGICGATSTPRWLMERVASCAKSIIGKLTVMIIAMLTLCLPVSCSKGGDTATATEGAEADTTLYHDVYQRGVDDAQRAMATDSASDDRINAVLAIHAAAHRLERAGMPNSADAYMQGARSVLEQQ